MIKTKIKEYQQNTLKEDITEINGKVMATLRRVPKIELIRKKFSKNCPLFGNKEKNFQIKDNF